MSINKTNDEIYLHKSLKDPTETRFRPLRFFALVVCNPILHLLQVPSSYLSFLKV